MRKKAILISICLFLLIAFIVAVIVLLPCEHEWISATCTIAKTCSKCQEIEGEPLGHSWEEAACEIPKTCARCSKTEGEPLGHRWKKATCQTPKKCSACSKTEGSVSRHSYVWDPSYAGGHNVCAYCNEPEPNIWCSSCGWSLFITGVGIDGIICPECGNRVL